MKVFSADFESVSGKQCLSNDKFWKQVEHTSRETPNVVWSIQFSELMTENDYFEIYLAAEISVFACVRESQWGRRRNSKSDNIARPGDTGGYADVLPVKQPNPLLVTNGYR